jgi:hypothetical protein
MKIIDGKKKKKFEPITLVIESEKEALVFLDAMNRNREITMKDYNTFEGLLIKRGIDTD